MCELLHDDDDDDNDKGDKLIACPEPEYNI